MAVLQPARAHSNHDISVNGLLREGTMELVAMELKQSGYFLARTLSYEASVLCLFVNIKVKGSELQISIGHSICMST